MIKLKLHKALGGATGGGEGGSVWEGGEWREGGRPEGGGTRGGEGGSVWEGGRV